MPRPRGGDWLEDEVRAWRGAGVDVIVSLLTSDEIAELELVHEAQLCEANGIRFLSLPIVDYGVPASRTDTLDFVKKLDSALAEGKRVAIHCRGGIGRAALIAACLLVLFGIDTLGGDVRPLAKTPRTPRNPISFYKDKNGYVYTHGHESP